MFFLSLLVALSWPKLGYPTTSINGSALKLFQVSIPFYMFQKARPFSRVYKNNFIYLKSGVSNSKCLAGHILQGVPGCIIRIKKKISFYSIFLRKSPIDSIFLIKSSFFPDVRGPH